MLRRECASGEVCHDCGETAQCDHDGDDDDHKNVDAEVGAGKTPAHDLSSVQSKYDQKDDADHRDGKQDRVEKIRPGAERSVFIGELFDFIFFVFRHDIFLLFVFYYAIFCRECQECLPKRSPILFGSP